MNFEPSRDKPTGPGDQGDGKERYKDLQRPPSSRTLLLLPAPVAQPQVQLQPWMHTHIYTYTCVYACVIFEGVSTLLTLTLFPCRECLKIIFILGLGILLTSSNITHT
ncbi:hypothetical protein FKM82_011808 [Ascaphus truei]